MGTAKAQISLRIRAVWSGPLLSANRTIGYYRMYDWRTKARMIFAYVQDDPGLRILRMFGGTFPLDATQLMRVPVTTR